MAVEYIRLCFPGHSCSSVPWHFLDVPAVRLNEDATVVSKMVQGEKQDPMGNLKDEAEEEAAVFELDNTICSTVVLCKRGTVLLFAPSCELSIDSPVSRAGLWQHQQEIQLVRRSVLLDFPRHTNAGSLDRLPCRGYMHSLEW